MTRPERPRDTWLKWMSRAYDAVFVTVLALTVAMLGFALWTFAFRRCDLHRSYHEGAVVMVTDVAALSTASLVCRGGRWEVLK